MAYGKIKADAIIYDNSGSDVEKTLVSLVTPDEGTAIKSTGESGTTKFLRVDGDGTCSWQVPPDTNTQLGAEAIQDVVGAMVTGNTETGIAVTYEDGDGTLDFVVGTLNQDTTGTAAIATTVTVADESSDTTCFPLFVTGATGNLAPKSGTNITFNSSTGLLSATAVTTTGDVVVGGDLTVSGSTTTVNTATLEVEDKNIELGKVSSPSDTTADGGGITLKGATDKTFNWVDATDSWTSSEHITVQKAGNAKILVGSTDASGAYIFLDGDSNGDFAGSDYSVIEHNASGVLLIKANSPSTATLQLGLGASGSLGAQFVEGGGAELRHNNTTRIATTAAGVTVTGTVTDSKGDLRKLTNNTQSSAYTLVASDAGKYVLMQGSGGNITIPGSVFSAGDMVTLINHTTSDITIVKPTNMFYTADGSNANRTLAGKGMATLIFTDANTCYISGGGLS